MTKKEEDTFIFETPYGRVSIVAQTYKSAKMKAEGLTYALFILYKGIEQAYQHADASTVDQKDRGMEH